MPSIVSQALPSVPDGFPSQLSGPLVWNNRDFVKKTKEYTYLLDGDDTVEIELAVHHFKGMVSSFILGCCHWLTRT